MFIGYNRSRHTLLAGLLDAYPHVVVANDLNILQQWITMPGIFHRKKYFIYELIYAKSRYDVMYGVRSRAVNGGPVQYHYNVKGQWQGKIHESVRVQFSFCYNHYSISCKQLTRGTNQPTINAEAIKKLHKPNQGTKSMVVQ